MPRPPKQPISFASAAWPAALVALFLVAVSPAIAQLSGDQISDAQRPNAQATKAQAAASETDHDRAYAAKQFAAAEKLAEQGELEPALRGYQRSYRWDARSTRPLEKIVPLAFRLGRIDEAVRYALLDIGAAEPPLLRQLALHLAENEQWADALRLFRLWLQRQPPATEIGAGERTAALLVRLEAARLEYLLDELPAASDSFATIQRVLLDRKSDDSAARRLRRATGDAPASLWETFGRCHLEAKQLGRAREAFEQMPSTEAGYWLAEVAAAEGKPFVAYDRLKDYFANRQATADEYGDGPYDLLKRLLIDLNDRDGLLTDLTRLSGASDPHAIAALAAAREAAGQGDAAAGLYRSLLAEPLLASRAAVWLVKHIGDEGQLIDLVDLLPALGAAMEDFSPLEEGLRNGLGNEPSARRFLSRLRRWSATDRSADTLAAAAWAARVAGDEELAARLHEAELTAAGDDAPRRLLNWSLNRLFGDKPGMAAEALQRGLRRGYWPDDPEPRFYLATSLALSSETDRQHDEAVAAAREAARLDPDAPDFAARLAWVLYNAERQAEAIDAYRSLIDTFDDDPDPATREVIKEARQTLSFLILKRGDAAEAAEWLEQVLDEFPGDPGALNDLAYLWAVRGKHLERSRRMAEAAVAAEPDSSAYLDTLAWTQFKGGDAAAALVSVERALEIEGAGADGDGADGEILDHWGDILAALGREDEAADAWRRAERALAESAPEMAAKVRAKLPAKPAEG